MSFLDDLLSKLRTIGITNEGVYMLVDKGQTIVFCIAVALVMVLSACQTTQNANIYDEAEKQEKVEDDLFHQYLSHEYFNLAHFEANKKTRSPYLSFFRGKAKKATKDNLVLPSDISDFKIPAYARDELSRSRATLMSILSEREKLENDQMVALAQTRFDCWLAQREEHPEKNVRLACREQFYKVVRIIQTEDLSRETYSVYFKVNSTELTKDSMKTIEHVVQAFKNRPDWSLMLEGLADSQGPADHNKTLSMRRAIAVRNALAQHGVDLEDVVIKAVGEVKGLALNILPDQQRRVDIIFQPFPAEKSDDEGEEAIPGWGHLQNDY